MDQFQDKRIIKRPPISNQAIGSVSEYIQSKKEENDTIKYVKRILFFRTIIFIFIPNLLDL